MLLRWLVNNYLRDAAQEKVREAVSGVLTQRSPRTVARPAAPQPSPSAETSAESPVESPAGSTAGEEEFLPCDVLFLFALGIESGGLADALTGVETSRHKHGLERAGKLDGREVAIVEGGVGIRAAARAAKAAIEFYRPEWVVSAGFAGALCEDLRRGHILMADRVAGIGGEELAVGIKLEPETLAATKGLHVGKLLTVEGIVRKAQERHELFRTHGAMACDMETLGVAQACRDLGAKLVSVRIISDAVDDELPPEIEALLDQKSLAGKLGAAAGAMLKRFSAAKDMWRLREDALKASDRLAKFLRGVVRQLP
ncbi:MAG: hypothetical protein WD872_18410 [Pirellulaceae bacterium]